MLSSKTNALLTHTLASFWRKQSCFTAVGASSVMGLLWVGGYAMETAGIVNKHKLWYEIHLIKSA